MSIINTMIVLTSLGAFQYMSYFLVCQYNHRAIK